MEQVLAWVLIDDQACDDWVTTDRWWYFFLVLLMVAGRLRKKIVGVR